MFTSARSIYPNFGNRTDDDKLSLILTNADMVLIVPKSATKYLIKEDYKCTDTFEFLIYKYIYICYQLYHIFILTITCHIVKYSFSYLCMHTTCFINMITNGETLIKYFEFEFELSITFRFRSFTVDSHVHVTQKLVYIFLK